MRANEGHHGVAVELGEEGVERLRAASSAVRAECGVWGWRTSSSASAGLLSSFCCLCSRHAAAMSSIARRGRGGVQLAASFAVGLGGEYLEPFCKAESERGFPS